MIGPGRAAGTPSAAPPDSSIGFLALDSLPKETSFMSLHTDYLAEIEDRKKQNLHPKPIEDGALVEELITQIKDTANPHREQSLTFFIYNTLPGTTSAAGAKARFLKEIILGQAIVDEITPSFAFELLSH